MYFVFRVHVHVFPDRIDFALDRFGRHASCYTVRDGVFKVFDAFIGQ
jgi:hypothetical protein